MITGGNSGAGGALKKMKDDLLCEYNIKTTI
jgi:hypothetical protein